jgi:replicative DNA helicase
MTTLAPPVALEFEEQLLGAVMVRSSLGAIQAEIALKPEHFYRQSHRLIFAAMVRLLNSGKPIQEATVEAELRKQGVLEEAGGRERLALLAATVNGVGHELHYAEEVRQAARWRQRYEAGQMMQGAATAEDDDRFSEAQALLAEGVTHHNALYDAERQKDLLFARTEGQGAAEFFWPLEKLNRLQKGGMRRGQFIVVSGYNNDGKSVFAGQLLDHNHKRVKVCLYTNEMDPEEEAERRAERHGVPASALEGGTGVDRLLEFLNSDNHWPITDIRGWSAEETCNHIRHHRWDFVVVDILHNFAFEKERELASIVRRFKATAAQANCCIVIVAHVNRGGVEKGKRRPPVKSDLRWSGEIDNIADCVCFVYREQNDKLRQTADGSIYFDKVRRGKLGGERVRFNESRLLFEVETGKPDSYWEKR